MKPIDTHNYINTYLQKEANTVCQVFEEEEVYSGCRDFSEEGKHRLAFTESPELPKFIKPKVEKLSAGVWNLVKQILP
jgi:hypothetical protein